MLAHTRAACFRVVVTHACPHFTYSTWPASPECPAASTNVCSALSMIRLLYACASPWGFPIAGGA